MSLNYYLDCLYREQKVNLVNNRKMNTKVQLDGVELTQKAAFKRITDQGYIARCGVLESDPEIMVELLKDTHDFNSFEKWVGSRVSETLKEMMGPKDDTDNFDIFSLMPMVDILTGDTFLWDNKSNNISVTSFKALQAVAGPSYINDLRKNNMIKTALFEYNPYILDKIRPGKADGMNIRVINTYNPPEWRFIQAKAHYREEIKEFFNHLFPDKKDKSLVFSYLKQAILHRCSHIMVLEGKRAVGKNIFVENIVAPLVGTKYFAKAPKGFFESRFQDILIDNRLIFFDELEAKDDNAMNDIKRLANHTQGVERKGRDLEQYNAYYSCIANTNDPQAFPVQFDERRIFFPEVTGERLEHAWSKERIKDFLNLLKDENVIAELGNFIINRDFDKDFDPENAYINDKFKEMVTLNLTPTRSYIVDYLINDPGEYVDLATMKSDYELDGHGGRFLSESKVRIFIENYLHDGKPLGEYVKVTGKGRININSDIQVNKGSTIAGDNEEFFNE